MATLRYQLLKNYAMQEKKGKSSELLINQLLDVVDDDEEALTMMIKILVKANRFDQAKWIQETYKIDVKDALSENEREVLEVLQFNDDAV
jgi:hypothetical protein